MTIDQTTLADPSLNLDGASLPDKPQPGSDVTRYVIVEVNSSNYGFPTGATVELMSSSAAAVTRVPMSPKFVRGVINHRGSIIPVVDTRALLGLVTAREQSDRVAEQVKGFELELLSWLDGLETAISAGEKFEECTDASKTVLGKWQAELMENPKSLQRLLRYDTSMRDQVRSIAEPHKRLYAAARKAIEMRDAGDAQGAIMMVKQARETELGELRRIFRRIKKSVLGGFKTMLVITELGERKAAFEVDSVHTVKDCADGDIEALPDTATGSEFMRGLVHQDGGGYVLICDLEQMYQLACPK
jgi:chemotaxis signal transduction protein